jgi:predicted  nucleic acid-binding Zn-ribbon protein
MKTTKTIKAKTLNLNAIKKQLRIAEKALNAAAGLADDHYTHMRQVDDADQSPAKGKASAQFYDTMDAVETLAEKLEEAFDTVAVVNDNVYEVRQLMAGKKQTGPFGRGRWVNR